jgi:curved DNA-binding protein CbpA
MTRQEAYKILNISEASNADEIKQAYKKQAKKYHPDLYQGDKKFAEDKMKQINEAYTLIMQKSTSSTYSRSNDDFYNQMIKDLDELIAKMRELDRIRKEREERRKKEDEELKKRTKKILTPIFIAFLLCMIVLSTIQISLLTRSLINFFNSSNWISFSFIIILGIISVAFSVGGIVYFILLYKKMTK